MQQCHLDCRPERASAATRRPGCWGTPDLLCSPELPLSWRGPAACGSAQLRLGPRGLGRRGGDPQQVHLRHDVQVAAPPRRFVRPTRRTAPAEAPHPSGHPAPPAWRPLQGAAGGALSQREAARPAAGPPARLSFQRCTRAASLGTGAGARPGQARGSRAPQVVRTEGAEETLNRKESFPGLIVTGHWAPRGLGNGSPVLTGMCLKSVPIDLHCDHLFGLFNVTV